MKEDQIDDIPYVVDPQPPLPADEAEVVAQLEQERLDVMDDGLLQIALAVLGLEVEELQQVRIADFFFRRHRVLGPRRLAFLQHRGLPLRQRGALVELRADLAVQLPHRPAAAKGLGLVEGAGSRVLDGQQPHVMRPGQGKGRPTTAAKSGAGSRRLAGAERRSRGSAPGIRQTASAESPSRDRRRASGGGCDSEKPRPCRAVRSWPRRRSRASPYSARFRPPCSNSTTRRPTSQ